jgi:FAD-linked sulfhydryl oxidase
MKFDAEIWGPHYWFFLHSVAESYPQHVNDVTKRKYYDLIQNMPLFIPDSEIGDKFSKMIDRYPVSPYLDNRDSFVRWMHFIHNKINMKLGKRELSLPMALERYRAEYKPKPLVLSEKINMRKHYIHAVLILLLLILIYIYH